MHRHPDEAVCSGSTAPVVRTWDFPTEPGMRRVSDQIEDLVKWCNEVPETPVRSGVKRTTTASEPTAREIMGMAPADPKWSGGVSEDRLEKPHRPRTERHQ